ncbi:Inositol-1 4 5-trisphosphate 5-phosphatase [Fasciola hepatica]|uniref:inositol-polyphosphate 5-phosphatase n=1 Tax=Fasciola hepatica TaxID=6192 RepID=A0A4E0RP34_FASHE|nr:Inositol-1 4 5-trisphosphate 5-phosphatase [Fasciola hepatica]
MEALFITTNTGSVELRVKCTVRSLDKLFERGELFCLFDNPKAILETTAELIAVHTQESNEQATKKLLNELTFGTKMCRNEELPCSQGNKRIFSFMNAADQSDEFTVQKYFASFSPSKSLRGWGQFICSNQTKQGWKFGILKTNSSSLFHRTKIRRQQNRTVQQSLLILLSVFCRFAIISHHYADEQCLKYCVDCKQFPAALFPSGTPSRKGFMRTRWRINGLVLEMVNIHLFNDSCNLLSLKEHPSVFARFRAAGLKWTLETIQADQNENQHLVIFGDFNFRLSLPLYVERLLSAQDAPFNSSVRLVEDNARSTIDQADTKFNRGDIVIGERQFHVLHDDRLTWSNFEPFLPLDEETLVFSDQLKELPIKFPPSYPFRDGAGFAHEYDATRCPAWCDRILFSKRTFSCLVPPDHCTMLYDLLGKDVALGDHKPVYAYCRLASD